LRYHIFRCTDGHIKYEASEFALWNGPWERNYIREVHDLGPRDLLLIGEEFWLLEETGWLLLEALDDGPTYANGAWGMLLANKLRNQPSAIQEKGSA